MYTLFVLFLSFGLLTACGHVSPPAATSSPLPEQTVIGTLPAPTPYTAPLVLRLWVPPRFDPAIHPLLQARLDAFTANHVGLRIEVRVKDEASLLETLNLTFAAAPAVLPDLIALPRTDLQSAATLGLIQPLETSILDDIAWDPSARVLGRAGDFVYGLPFALDVLVLTSHMQDLNLNWQDAMEVGPLAYNANDVYFPLSMYLSAGGALIDGQGQPALDEVVLTRVLSLFAQGRILPLESDKLVRSSLDQGNGIAVGWISDFASGQEWDIRFEAIPGLGEEPVTLITSWNWSIAGHEIERQRLAHELAVWLVDSGFLSDWVETTGFLPPYTDPRWEPLLVSSRPVPSVELLTVIAPVLRDAVESVLDGVPPDSAAHSAVERLK